MEEKKEDGMGTLKKDRTLLRDERKMEKLKAKLHTDDDREFRRISVSPDGAVDGGHLFRRWVCAKHPLAGLDGSLICPSNQRCEAL